MISSRVELSGVVDAPGEKAVSLALATALTEEGLSLHYFGTRSRSWTQDKFALVYIDSKTSEAILRKPLPTESATPLRLR